MPAAIATTATLHGHLPREVLEPVDADGHKVPLARELDGQRKKEEVIARAEAEALADRRSGAR